MQKASRLVFTLFLLLAALATQAQRDSENEYLYLDKVVPPDDVKPKTIEDLLAQLAWKNNPSNKGFQHKVALAETERKQKKWSWTEAAGGSVNFFPSDQTLIISGSTYLVPGISYGASINLRPLIYAPYERKMAQEKVEIAKADLNQEKLKIRAEVLERYRDYLVSIEILKTRSKALEDALLSAKYMEELFKTNDESIDYPDFLAAKTNALNAEENKIRADSELEIAKIRLLETVGLSSWEELEYEIKQIKK